MTADMIAEQVGQVRPLTSKDLDDVTRLLNTDPIANCFLASRVQFGGADPWRLGGELLGYVDRGGVQSLVFAGANLITVNTDEAMRASFADRLRRGGRRCSSLVGPTDEIMDLWRLLEPSWGPAREVRANQPLLAIDGPPEVQPDPRVRLATSKDLNLLIPACIEMFTAEVGISPVSGGAGPAYRARVAEIVEEGRSFVRIDNDVVVFKAEVGAVAKGVCQVQGVWVDPQLRGKGISKGGMAAVVQQSRAAIAPTVSLYVNGYNTAARKAYASVGFSQVGTFATVLF